MGRKGAGVDQKSLMSIKEFSQLTGISQSTLRYYDEIGLFHPSVRKPNGYRYYSVEQITAVNFVQVMSFLGVPLKDIKGLADERGPRQLSSELLGHSVHLSEELRKISELYSLMGVYQQLINEGISVKEGEISLRELAATPIAMGPPTTFTSDADFHEPFMEFYEDANAHKVNLAYPIGGYFKDMDSFSMAPGSPDRFFSLDPSGTDQIAAGTYLIGYTRGYYGVVNDLPQRLISAAEKHQVRFSGPVYKLVILDEVSEPDPKNYLLRVSALVEPL